MANEWFRVPSTTGEQGGNVPKYYDRVDAHSGNVVSESGLWVVRFYGTQEELDAIAAESDATRLSSSVAASALSNSANLNATLDGDSVNAGFRVGS